MPAFRLRRMIRGVVFAIALVAIWLGVFALTAGLPWDAPLNSGKRLTLEGRDFLVRSGTGKLGARGLEISAFGADGTALQTARLGRARSEQTPILRYRISDFPKTLELALIFRRSDAPEDVQSISLPAPILPEAAVDLTRLPQWHGEILEVGFAEYAAGQVVAPDNAQFAPFRIERVSLQARSWSEIFPRLLSDWFGYRPWALLSISALGPQLETLPTSSMTVAIGIGGVLSLLAGWLTLGWSKRRLLQASCVTALGAWLLLDLRWLDDFLSKHRVIETLYADKSWEERAKIQPDDDTLRAAAELSKFAAEVGAKRILVTGDSQYTTLRLVYFLLPLNAAPMVSVLAASPGGIVPADTLIAVLGNDAKYDAEKHSLQVAATTLSVVPVHEQGALRVYRPSESAR
ncbi:MAG: hypothetical protein ABI846_12070 [Rudaea sp.]